MNGKLIALRIDQNSNFSLSSSDGGTAYIRYGAVHLALSIPSQDRPYVLHTGAGFGFTIFAELNQYVINLDVQQKGALAETYLLLQQTKEIQELFVWENRFRLAETLAGKFFLPVPGWKGRPELQRWELHQPAPAREKLFQETPLLA
jgi:hypothetical protein